MVSCLYRVINENGEKLDESSIERMRIDNKIIESYGINARFFKKDLFKNGIISKDDKGRTFLSNDIEYMIRFAIDGAKNKTIDYIGYNHLSHKNSISFSSSLKSEIQKYEDKIFIAKLFLNSDKKLPKIWLDVFKKWIKKYRAKITAKHLKNLDFKPFYKNFIFGAQENGMLKFSFYFLKTFFRK